MAQNLTENWQIDKNSNRLNWHLHTFIQTLLKAKFLSISFKSLELENNV